VASALDMIIHLERIQDGSRKVVAITEVQRMESDVITLQDLYRFEIDTISSDHRVRGELVGSGLRPGFLDKFHKRGVSLPGWLNAEANGEAQGFMRAEVLRDASH
jgi:pilus assembly protein CpaF